MNTPPRCTDARLIAASRELDRVLRPINDRILAELGLTRAELLAMPHPNAVRAEEARRPQLPPSPPLPGEDTTA